MMGWLQLPIVVNCNACVRTRGFEQCIFNLVRGLCVSVPAHSVADGCYYTLFCPTSHPWCQKHSPPALHLHFKRPAGKRRAPHFYYIFLPFPFCLLENSSRFNRPLLSYQQCSKFTLDNLNTLSSAQLTHSDSNTFQWQQQQSHVTFCPDIYIIPMVPRSSLLEALPAVKSIYLTSAQVVQSVGDTVTLCLSDCNV